MKKISIFLVAAALTVVACKKKTNDPPADSTDPYAVQKTNLKTTYADLAFAMYDDALISAEVLNTKLAALVSNPSQQTMDDAKEAWLDAREAYGQTEVFRFVDGPIDNPTDGPEGLINAWPMDEAHVDYVDGNTTTGIINNTADYPAITAEVIINANEFGGEANVSAGYHAIEFLLWGQDMSTTGPGARPFTDYTTANNSARRGQYLVLLGEILVQALDQVRDEWDPAGSNNYRVTWLAMNSNTALRKMFNSLRVLSGDELRGERILVAYENQDQEDEHSCFSDNTHRDIALNALGMVSLYNGTYIRTNGTTVEGYSISDLVAEENSTLNFAILARLGLTANAINNMHTPFDRAIVEPAYRPGVLEVINQLGEESEIFTDAAAEFDIVF